MKLEPTNYQLALGKRQGYDGTILVVTDETGLVVELPLPRETVTKLAGMLRGIAVSTVLPVDGLAERPGQVVRQGRRP